MYCCKMYNWRYCSYVLVAAPSKYKYTSIQCTKHALHENTLVEHITYYILEILHKNKGFHLPTCSLIYLERNRLVAGPTRVTSGRGPGLGSPSLSLPNEDDSSLSDKWWWLWLSLWWWLRESSWFCGRRSLPRRSLAGDMLGLRSLSAKLTLSEQLE